MKLAGVAVDTLSLTLAFDGTKQIIKCASRENNFGVLAVLLHVEVLTVTFPYKQREIGGAEEQSRARMDVHAVLYCRPVSSLLLY